MDKLDVYLQESRPKPVSLNPQLGFGVCIVILCFFGYFNTKEKSWPHWNNFYLEEVESYDSRFNQILLVSICIVLPSLWEVVFDFLKFRKYFDIQNWLTRLLLILSLCIPNFILYNYSSSENQNFDTEHYLSSKAHLYLFTYNIQRVFRMSFVLYFLNCKASLSLSDKSAVWTPRRGSVILITYAFGTGCEVYSQLVKNNQVADSLYIAMIAFYIFSAALFVVCFLFWIQRNLYFIFSDTHTHKSTYFCCFVYCVALICTVLVETILTYHCSDNALHSYSVYHTMANGSRSYSIASMLIITNTVFILSTTHMARNYSNIDIISSNAEVKCKHTFVRYVSHAIRSPMAVIKGGLDVLESILLNKDANIHYTPDEVERNKILLDIKLSCDYSVTLLNNLLTLDKIERGNLPLICIPHTHAITYFNSVIKPYHDKTAEFNISLVFVLAGTNAKFHYYTSHLHVTTPQHFSSKSEALGNQGLESRGGSMKSTGNKSDRAVPMRRHSVDSSGAGSDKSSQKSGLDPRNWRASLNQESPSDDLLSSLRVSKISGGSNPSHSNKTNSTGNNSTAQPPTSTFSSFSSATGGSNGNPYSSKTLEFLSEAAKLRMIDYYAPHMETIHSAGNSPMNANSHNKENSGHSGKDSTTSLKNLFSFSSKKTSHSPKNDGSPKSLPSQPSPAPPNGANNSLKSVRSANMTSFSTKFKTAWSPKAGPTAERSLPPFVGFDVSKHHAVDFAGGGPDDSAKTSHHIDYNAMFDSVHLNIDSIKLSAVLHTLINNAIKYSPEGSQITFKLEFLNTFSGTEKTNKTTKIMRSLSRMSTTYLSTEHRKQHTSGITMSEDETDEPPGSQPNSRVNSGRNLTSNEHSHMSRGSGSNSHIDAGSYDEEEAQHHALKGKGNKAKPTNQKQSSSSSSLLSHHNDKFTYDPSLKYIRFSVTDSGDGIAAKDGQTIFEDITRFNPGKLHGGSTGHDHDSGLGLHISKVIAEMHHGRLAFYSLGLPGQGTTFTLDLPYETKTPNQVRQALTENLLSVSMKHTGNNQNHSKLVSQVTEEMRNVSCKQGNARWSTVQADSRRSTLDSTTDSPSPVKASRRMSLPGTAIEYLKTMGSVKHSPSRKASVDFSVPILTAALMNATNPSAKIRESFVSNISSKDSFGSFSHRGGGFEMRQDTVDEAEDISGGGEVLPFVLETEELATITSDRLITAMNSSSEDSERHKISSPTLDFRVTQSSSMSIEIPPIAPSSAPATAPRKYKILLVDDVQSVRKMMGRALKMNNIEWEEAEDGDVAVEMIRKLMPFRVDAGSERVSGAHSMGGSFLGTMFGGRARTGSSMVSDVLNSPSIGEISLACASVDSRVSTSQLNVQLTASPNSSPANRFIRKNSNPNGVNSLTKFAAASSANKYKESPQQASRKHFLYPSAAVMDSSSLDDTSPAVSNRPFFSSKPGSPNSAKHPPRVDPATSSDIFDAIAMDFTMARMNGPEATRLIRELGYTGAIIGVTGNITSDDPRLLREAGCNAVFGKPCGVETFLNAMFSVYGMPLVADPNAKKTPQPAADHKGSMAVEELTDGDN